MGWDAAIRAAAEAACRHCKGEEAGLDTNPKPMNGVLYHHWLDEYGQIGAACKASAIRALATNGDNGE